jgi:TldD protein
VATLLDQTIGVGTELDRAMGITANGLGTSFLTDPVSMVGQYVVGAPAVNISTNRSMPRGAATVGWDDEGVQPMDTPLVTKGVVTEFQTTRESAMWLRDYDRHLGRPTRSNGCAGTDVITTPVSQTSPNFVLAPVPHAASFEDLIRDTKQGLAVFNGSVDMDQQALNGAGKGWVREIKNGVLGDPIQGVRYVFRTPNFWKNVTALGGPETARHFGVMRSRQRFYESCHTVSAVPMAVQGVAVTDEMHRA